MIKSRRYQSAEVRFIPALKALLVCVAMGFVGVGYVWHINQVRFLGRQIVEGDKRQEQLGRETRELEKQLAYLKSPAVLKTLIVKHNLSLGMTHPEQVLILPEPREGGGWQPFPNELTQASAPKAGR